MEHLEDLRRLFHIDPPNDRGDAEARGTHENVFRTPGEGPIENSRGRARGRRQRDGSEFHGSTLEKANIHTLEPDKGWCITMKYERGGPLLLHMIEEMTIPLLGRLPRKVAEERGS